MKHTKETLENIKLMKITSKAPEMYEALKEIAEKLDDGPMNINSKEFMLWEIANEALGFPCVINSEYSRTPDGLDSINIATVEFSCVINSDYDNWERNKIEQKANAKLISKAPEMYEALKEIAEKLDDEPMNINSKEFMLWEIANEAKEIES
jgi:hypothetical protein